MCNNITDSDLAFNSIFKSSIFLTLPAFSLTCLVVLGMAMAGSVCGSSTR